jgi:hypothetical protein
MLPFLQPKKMSSTIMAKVKPAGDLVTESVESEMDPGLMSVAEDILSAIAGKDATRLAQSLQAAFQMFDMAPHVEGEHVE